jgi:hypothetical protein
MRIFLPAALWYYYNKVLNLTTDYISSVDPRLWKEYPGRQEKGQSD